MGMVTLDGSMELLRVGPAFHGEKVPQEEGRFFLGEKNHPQIPLGNQSSVWGGSHLPGSQTSRTLKDRDIPMDEPHWTQALTAPVLQLDSGP